MLQIGLVLVTSAITALVPCLGAVTKRRTLFLSGVMLILVASLLYRNLDPWKQDPADDELGEAN